MSWHRSFVGKKRKKKLGRLLRCVYFGSYGKKEIRELLIIEKARTQ